MSHRLVATVPCKSYAYFSPIGTRSPDKSAAPPRRRPGLSGVPLLKITPVVHDVGAIGDAQRFADVVVGDEHADAALLQVKDDLLDVGDRDRVDAGERLVEQDELRRHHQRARDLGAPPLAARQRVRGRLRERRQVQLRQQLAQPRPPRRAVERHAFRGSPGCSARPSARGRSTAPAAGSRCPCARGCTSDRR